MNHPHEHSVCHALSFREVSQPLYSERSTSQSPFRKMGMWPELMVFLDMLSVRGFTDIVWSSKGQSLGHCDPTETIFSSCGRRDCSFAKKHSNSTEHVFSFRCVFSATLRNRKKGSVQNWTEKERRGRRTQPTHVRAASALRPYFIGLFVLLAVVFFANQLLLWGSRHRGIPPV